MINRPVLSDYLTAEQIELIAKRISEASQTTRHITVVLEIDTFSGLRKQTIAGSELAPPGKPSFMQKNPRYRSTEDAV